MPRLDRLLLAEWLLPDDVFYSLLGM